MTGMVKASRDETAPAGAAERKAGLGRPRHGRRDLPAAGAAAGRDRQRGVPRVRARLTTEFSALKYMVVTIRPGRFGNSGESSPSSVQA
jgi:hypothetical protein